MTKIVHAPTLQQRILDASWDTTSIPSPLAAIMFVIYLLSVTNMPSSDYEASFNESRTTVMLRYRTATVRALMEADFLQTKDLEVLQALVLFLFADPESDLTLTMTAIAVKIGFNIGLHRECEPKVSLFEQEMRIRLWLQLRGIEYRSHSVSMSWPNRMRSELDAHRLPLNVNDTELHPDMTDLPVEHTGPTEMLCVLMKFAVPNWFRTSPLGAKLFERIRCHSRDSTSPEEDSAAIDELQELYRKKFLSNLDDRIPLHGLAMTIAARSIAAMRFKINHPRGKAGAKEGDVYMTRGELDMLFDSAVTSLDLKKASVEPGFAVHLLTPMTSKFELDSYIYILSDLRERCSGDRVALAWRIIGDLYSGHPELISDTDNTFYVALGDLTLEAWEARSKELQGGRDMREFDLTPPFIQALWDKRRDKNRDNVQAPSDLDPYAFGTMDGYYDLDWVYWNNFLRI